MTQAWTEARGIEVRSITISATVPDEDRAKINEWNEKAMLRSQDYQSAMTTEAMATFLKNSSLGGGDGKGASGVDAMMGMMAMNMMQQNMQPGGAFNPNQAAQNMAGAQAAQPAPAAPVEMKPASTVEEGAILGWECVCGKKDNRGRFCSDCGLPKPALDGWTCSCGHVNKGKFCQECGKKKPEGAPIYRCDKCGWEPEDPTKPPKFCPECGDIFDENDIQK